MANSWGDAPVATAPVANDWGDAPVGAKINDWGDSSDEASPYSEEGIAKSRQELVASTARRRQLLEEADAAALLPRIKVGINPRIPVIGGASVDVPEELVAFGSEAIKSSPATAAGVAAASAVLPAANRIGAAVSALPIPLAPAAGAAIMVGAPLFAGGAAALGTRYAQDELLPQILPETAREVYESSGELAARNPNSALLGQIAGAGPFFRPGLPIGTTGGARLAVPAITGAVGGGIEAAQQIAADDFDPQRLALATAGGALMNRETRLGARIAPNMVAPHLAPHEQQIAERAATRMEGKPTDQQLEIAKQEIALAPKDVSDDFKRGATEIEQALETKLAQEKAAADAVKAAEKAQADQQRAIEQQQKAVTDAQKQASDAQAAAQEVPKSTQILQEGSKPPPIANVATEAGTQTSPFALQGKINEITGTAPPQIVETPPTPRRAHKAARVAVDDEAAIEAAIKPEPQQTKDQAIKAALETPGVDFQYAVFRPGHGIKDVVQVDVIAADKSASLVSSNPKDLNAAGAKIPDVPEWVPQGKYTLDELKALIKEREPIEFTAPAQMKREDLRAELRAAGVTEIKGTPLADAAPNQLMAEVGRQRSQRGSVSPSVVGTAGGAAVGGAAGYATADPQAPGESDEAYRSRLLSRTLAGTAIGAAGGAVGASALSRGAQAREKINPSAARPRVTAPKAGEKKGIRHLATRVIENKDQPTQLRKILSEDPAIVYDKFLLGDLIERSKAATTEELNALRASADRNEQAAATIELANRASAEGREAEGAELYAQSAKLFTSSAQLLNVAKAVRSPVGYVVAIKETLKELGRTTTPAQEVDIKRIAAASIQADQRLARAERLAKEDFTPENQRAYEEAKEGAGAAKRELTNYLNKITPEGWDDLTIKIIQGNMLTPLSQGANIGGNIMFQPVRRGAMALASLMDAVYSAATGKPRVIDRTNPLPRGAELEAFADGVKIAGKELLTGPSTESYVKNEVQRGFQPLRALMQAVTGKELPVKADGTVAYSDRFKKLIEGTLGVAPETMFRLLNFGDKPFRRMAEIETVLEQGRLRGLKGRNLEKFIEFPDKATQALLDTEARKAIFAQENAGVRQLSQFLDSGLAKLLHVDQIPALKGAIKVFGRLNVPFRQFPLNYVNTALNFAAPELALAKAAYYSFKGDRRKALINIGEGLMGQIMYGAAAYLWKHGLISEPTDKDAKQRSIQYDNMGGQRINLSGLARQLAGEDSSWQRDDTTVDWGRAGIPAPVFFVYTKDQAKDRKALQRTGVRPEDDQSPLGSYASRVKSYPGIASFALEQSFAAGTSAFLEAWKNGFTGPEADAWAANMFRAASTLAVPNTVEALARAEYEYIPELRGDTLRDTLKNIWDFKTFQLPKDDRAVLKRDLWGEPVKRTPEGVNPYIYQFVDVSKTSGKSRDQFKENLIKIFNESDNPGAYPSLPDRNMTLQGVTAKLEPKDYETLQALTGRLRRQEAEPVVLDPGFNAIPAGERVAELEKIYSTAYRDAKETLLASEEFRMKYFPELFGGTPSERVTGRNTQARNRLELQPVKP